MYTFLLLNTIALKIAEASESLCEISKLIKGGWLNLTAVPFLR